MIETAFHRVLAKIFHDTGREQLQQVENLCRLKGLSAGDILVREGDKVESLYFIIEGRIAVQKETAMAGKRQAVALLSAGSVVGEGALSNNTCHGATLVCVEKCVLGELTRNAFSALEESNPEVACRILKGVLGIASLRLRKSSERLARIL